MKYFLDITFDEPVKIESSEHDSIESALNMVYQCVQPRIRGASLPFHAWVHPTGVKQLTLDLRRTLEGWSVVNTDRVNNLVSIQISRQDATRAIDAALDLSYGYFDND